MHKFYSVIQQPVVVKHGSFSGHETRKNNLIFTKKYYATTEILLHVAKTITAATLCKIRAFPKALSFLLMLDRHHSSCIRFLVCNTV